MQLSFSLSLSLTSEEGVHTNFTSQRERIKERERKKERERGTEREKEAERSRI
jgi:hypothetical protein